MIPPLAASTLEIGSLGATSSLLTGDQIHHRVSNRHAVWNLLLDTLRDNGHTQRRDGCSGQCSLLLCHRSPVVVSRFLAVACSHGTLEENKNHSEERYEASDCRTRTRNLPVPPPFRSLAFLKYVNFSGRATRLAKTYGPYTLVQMHQRPDIHHGRKGKGAFSCGSLVVSILIRVGLHRATGLGPGRYTAHKDRKAYALADFFRTHLSDLPER